MQLQLRKIKINFAKRIIYFLVNLRKNLVLVMYFDDKSLLNLCQANDSCLQALIEIVQATGNLL